MFIQSCYIGKNSKELKEELENLGYKHGGKDIDSVGNSALYCNTSGEYFEIYPSCPTRFENIMDCDTNEKLFLAIAALRDDSDNFSLFGVDGIKELRMYDHYAPYKGEWPQWAKDEVKKL